MTEDGAKQEAIGEELLIISHSGELPEIAFYSSLYYLAEDPDGPHLNLDDEDVSLLEDAVLQRYLKIILRDLNPKYRSRSIFRGVGRAIANWYRLQHFCERQNLARGQFREQIAEALSAFFREVCEELDQGKEASNVNCSQEDLSSFVEELQLDESWLPGNWRKLCS